MPGMWWIVAVAAAAALLVAGFVILRPVMAARREARQAEARRQFRRRREYLEAKFFELAASLGSPRGLRWVDCDFDNEVAYARDRRSRRLSAFVGVSIGFEAIEGGGMEDVEAVGNIRAATAVFHFDDGRDEWTTEGRAIFNLNPAEAIRHFRSQLEMVVD